MNSTEKKKKKKKDESILVFCFQFRISRLRLLLEQFPIFHAASNITQLIFNRRDETGDRIDEWKSTIIQPDAFLWWRLSPKISDAV